MLQEPLHYECNNNLSILYVTVGAAQGYECYPSEGGHAEFAPHDNLQLEMLKFLTIKLGGRVSVERVVSGSGIPNVSTVKSYGIIAIVLDFKTYLN
jgi:hypothetical protein